MMNTNKEHATQVALNGTGQDNGSEARKSSAGDNGAGRSFTAMDLWSIRRNVRSLKIHNRIPRL